MPLPQFALALGGHATFTAEPEDANGNPGAIVTPPNPTFTVNANSNPALVSLAPSGDGMSCVITSTGAPGTVQIDWTTQSNIGAGGAAAPLVASFDIVVAEGPATQVVFAQSS